MFALGLPIAEKILRPILIYAFHDEIIKRLNQMAKQLAELRA